MAEETCPLCGSQNYLTSFYSLRIIFTEWPWLVFFAGLVLVAGEFLNAGRGASVWFAVMAVFPFLFRLVRKHACLRCRIEYEAPREETLFREVR